MIILSKTKKYSSTPVPYFDSLWIPASPGVKKDPEGSSVFYFTYLNMQLEYNVYIFYGW